MRETIKRIKIGPEGEEKEYQIHKMNALAGSYLIKFCSEKLLPVYNSLQNAFSSTDTDIEGLTDEQIAEKEAKVAKERTQAVIRLIPEALSKLSEKELMEFEVRCLQTVEILKPAGWQAVMINGRFGDEDLEYDLGTVLRLVYEVLVFNLGSFFGGANLSSLLNNSGSSLPNA